MYRIHVIRSLAQIEQGGKLFRNARIDRKISLPDDIPRYILSSLNGTATTDVAMFNRFPK